MGYKKPRKTFRSSAVARRPEYLSKALTMARLAGNREDRRTRRRADRCRATPDGCGRMRTESTCGRRVQGVRTRWTIRYVGRGSEKR
eukprot:scaffold1311_cov256-Pinguiococcus_pyrenoidosus.AAC.13